MTANDPTSAPASGSHRPPGNNPSSDTLGRQKTPLAVADRWYLTALLVFTVIVRGTVLWAMRDNLTQDPDAYREIAENLLVYGEFALGKPNPDNAESQPRP